MSQTMKRKPISVRERVLSVSGSAGRLGQNRLGGLRVSVWFGCWKIGWAALYYSD
jgi:hypothetical protein